jgi:PilZ domain
MLGPTRGSALFVVLHSARMPPEKRDTDRVAILGELHGEIMVFEPMAIKEISRGGAQVETGFPLQLNSLHDLRLTLGDRSVVVKGRVVHCRISDVDQDIVMYRSGIEFVEPSDRVQSVILDFLDSIKAGRRAE